MDPEEGPDPLERGDPAYWAWSFAVYVVLMAGSMVAVVVAGAVVRTLPHGGGQPLPYVLGGALAVLMGVVAFLMSWPRSPSDVDVKRPLGAVLGAILAGGGLLLVTWGLHLSG